MDNRVLHTLEFNKITKMLSEFAVSELGKTLCLNLKPFEHMDRVIQEQTQTDEACRILYFLGYSPVQFFDDIRPFASIAQKGGVLSPRALLNIATMLKSAREAYNALVHKAEVAPRLAMQASLLTLLPSLEQNISDSIYSDDEISDHASSTLANIRKKIRQAHAKVREKLNNMIKSQSFQKYLQEPIITIRQERFVLPIKLEYRAQVPGLIHDQSTSGATLFIEPMSIVEINNDIKQLLGEEKQEIARILEAFSAEVAQFSDALSQNISILEQLDFCFAKAGLAKSMGGIMPKINNRGYIKIVQGKHPLLQNTKVVPLDFWIGEDFSTLVITGPNTGGKTVALKTVGLFILMTQAGLQLPAQLGSEMSIFKAVFADIGDEQSIEQSLSTFSAHMKNIVHILNHIQKGDFAAFDELGAGTDPTEGAALAQAILSHLSERGVTTLATTHYSELKAYALTIPNIENGSMEFDIESLSPTYRLSIGIPGKSNAFEISRKLGLSEQVIDDAKKLISKNDIKFEEVIASAEYHKKIAEKERSIAEQMQRETLSLRNEAEKLRTEMEEKRRTATSRAKEEARQILQRTRMEAESILSELKKLRKDAMQAQSVNKLKTIDHMMDELVEPLQASDGENALGETLNIGDRVLILNLNTEANVISSPDTKGDVLVQAGSMKMKCNPSNLKKIAKQKTKTIKPVASIKNNASSVPLEVDVRGMNLDEAIIEVDAYLYRASMVGYKEVYIIHGKGTGVLKKGIGEHLKRQKHIKSFRLGMYGEGEDGVTVVSLK